MRKREKNKNVSSYGEFFKIQMKLRGELLPSPPQLMHLASPQMTSMAILQCHSGLIENKTPFPFVTGELLEGLALIPTKRTIFSGTRPMMVAETGTCLEIQLMKIKLIQSFSLAHLCQHLNLNHWEAHNNLVWELPNCLPRNTGSLKFNQAS